MIAFCRHCGEDITQADPTTPGWSDLWFTIDAYNGPDHSHCSSSPSAHHRPHVRLDDTDVARFLLGS